MKKEMLRESGAEQPVETLQGLLKGRADAYEIFFSYDKGLSAEAKEGAIDALKVRSARGVGVRTVSGGRPGFAFSSVLSKDALKELVDNAISGSLAAAKDDFLRFAPKTEAKAAELGAFDEGFATVTEAEKLKSALDIEAAALGADARIKRVRKASYSETLHFSWVVNSNGVDASHSATYYSGSVTAVAEEAGESQMGWEVGMGHRRSAIDPETIGQGAARNAVMLLGAKKIKTIKCPAIFENTIAIELLESLASSFLGDNVQKGKSMLAGKAGKKIASGAVGIHDDGLLPGGWASSLYDGEGAARKRTTLVEKGVCMGYLYDAYWAARASVESTGNASRSNYKSYPSVGVSNLFIGKGEKSLDELLKSAGTGLFITEVLGAHTINTVSGDFSIGASGFFIEGGRLSYPVRGLAIAGNLLEIFLKVEACGADMRFIGSHGAPSLLVTELEASGI